jgi:hypothetical protein
MRRAFNLIELIFTIVIMAGVFAVIPKIIFATNKSDSFAMKQDAFFNAISLTNIASLLAWDEENTDSMSILATANNQIECNTTTFLRKGGFLGANSRNCKEPLTASAIGADGESDYLAFNDIDDFDAHEINVTLGSKTKYKIYTTVEYFDDDIFTTNGDKMTITLKDANDTTTNIKKFKAVVGYVGGRGKDKNITSFYYYSTNIGQITLNSEEW